ncbi:MAG TPA: PQQ-binding-like beta-propeller repeat protein [Planctomycetota bacterium]|nr:PQQ-binding-like beta-propeller repeat protein [Planctomycetota bacterium]
MIAALLGFLLGLQARPDPLDQWPQFRGPSGNGHAPHGDPPLEWSETKNVRWKVEIPGAGSATPVVWGDRIFVLTAIDTGSPGSGGRTLHRFDVLALDRATGSTLWRKTATEQVPHEGLHATNTYASGSPATDGKILIASFGSRGLFAYDLDGALRWKRDLGPMKIKVGFGEGISPVLWDGFVVVNRDHEAGSEVVCLEAQTGESRWRQARDEGTTWTTPLVVEDRGVTQVVINGTKKTRSYELATGKLLWECGGQGMNPIPVPVARGGVVYCMTGYKGYSIAAIRLDSRGDVTGSGQVVWSRHDAAPYVASPLLYEDLIYFGKEREPIVACIDAASGEVQWGPERIAGLDTLYASPAGAAGRIYLAGRNGTTVVLKHGRTFEILATNVLPEGIDASPVIVGRRLYLRTARHLYAIGTD